MITLLRTTDNLTINFVRMVLEQAGIGVFVADTAISAMEGGIGAFPLRLMVHDDDAAAARRIVAQAGYGHELIADT